MNSTVFLSLESALVEQLAPKGFVRNIVEVDGPFGSHYVDYARGEEAFRLVADGKESKVFVCYSTCFERPIPHQDWQDLLSVPYAARWSSEAMDLLRERIVLALAGHKGLA